MSYYVEPKIIKEFAEGPEADDSPVWDILAGAASRVFDQAAEVAENFFAPAEEEVSEKIFYANGTKYLKLSPFVADSITQVLDEDDTEIEDYRIEDIFLVFDADQLQDKVLKVTANWGFDTVPDDIKMAVVEQALFMWRRKDLSFAEMSGVNANSINAPLSPTCEFVANKYKQKYLNYFV